jgi:ubiquinone/menaquinone biosynthesis C-methylase UbiE
MLDWAMADSTLAQYRELVLADVHGDILEIGFGTGLNLTYYPDHVEKLTTIDVNPGMNALAERRIRASKIDVEHRVLNGESLPMPDESFDYVVSTWTLCSIARVNQALQEIYRVLKPGGKFVFVEHGLSDNPKVQVWQNRLTPIQNVIADGCHFNRNIRQLVESQFSQIEIETFVPENIPELVMYTYKGIATKSA